METFFRDLNNLQNACRSLKLIYGDDLGDYLAYSVDYQRTKSSRDILFQMAL